MSFFQPNHAWENFNKKTDTEHLKTYKCAYNTKAKGKSGSERLP